MFVLCSPMRQRLCSYFLCALSLWPPQPPGSPHPVGETPRTQLGAEPGVKTRGFLGRQVAELLRYGKGNISAERFEVPETALQKDEAANGCSTLR